VLQIAGAAGASGVAIGSAGADPNGPDGYEIEELDAGLDHAWGIAFLPDDRLLVTERDGRLNCIDRDDGTVETIDGTPEVYVHGQGGLLDVTLHPDFETEPWVYLTYAAINEEGDSTTHLGRGRFERGSGRLEGFEELFVAEPFIYSENHFGSRILFHEGALYMTVGDRDRKDFGPDHVAQDTSNALGATLRFAPDGSIPEDNPFVGDDAHDAIYSYGHRNVQAMTVHPKTGELWQAEHGEEDGDEINIIEEGSNYGWPLAHYGCKYGTEVPVGDLPHEREDVVNPVYYWECPDPDGGFPPSGATFYDGEAFPDWRGDLFVGNIFREYLGRFTVDGRDVEEVDPLLADYGQRVRDVAVAPDTGHLYVLFDEEDAPVVRLVPE
jgi:hypothetical protein